MIIVNYCLELLRNGVMIELLSVPDAAVAAKTVKSDLGKDKI